MVDATSSQDFLACRVDCCRTSLPASTCSCISRDIPTTPINNTSSCSRVSPRSRPRPALRTTRGRAARTVRSIVVVWRHEEQQPSRSS